LSDNDESRGTSPGGSREEPQAEPNEGQSGRMRPGGRATNLNLEVESNSGKRKLIIGLTWPALAENLFTSISSIIDMIMVSALGAQAIGAVGLIAQPRFVMLAAFMALNIGATAMVARFRGARDRESANMVFNQALLIGISISTVLSVVMWFGGPGLIRFLAGSNISGDMIAGANSYLRIQIFSFPLLALTFTINAALRGVGNTRAAFYNNGVANIVKIFFNFCLIGGNLGFPALGLTGAALSMVISQFAAFSMAFSKVISGREYIQVELKKLFHIDLSMIRRILRIGIPALIEQVFMRTGMMLFTIIVTSLGDYSYAAHMIAMNVQQVAFMTGMSFGTASTSLVGQCLGRMRSDLARVYVRLTQHMNVMVSVFVTLLLFFFGEYITSFYSEDAELVRLSASMLRIIAIANPFSSSRFVFVSALRGAGDARYTAAITFVGILLIRPIVSILLVFPPFPFQIGLTGVWIALVSDGLVCFFLAWTRFRRGKWADIKV